MDAQRIIEIVNEIEEFKKQYGVEETIGLFELKIEQFNNRYLTYLYNLKIKDKNIDNYEEILLEIIREIFINTTPDNGLALEKVSLVLENTKTINSEQIVDIVLTHIQQNHKKIPDEILVKALVMLTIKNEDQIKTIENYLLGSDCLKHRDRVYNFLLSLYNNKGHINEIGRWEDLVLKTCLSLQILNLALAIKTFDMNKLGKKVIKEKQYDDILQYAVRVSERDKAPFIEAILKSDNIDYIRQLERIQIEDETMLDKIRKRKTKIEMTNLKNSIMKRCKDGFAYNYNGLYGDVNLSLKFIGEIELFKNKYGKGNTIRLFADEIYSIKNEYLSLLFDLKIKEVKDESRLYKIIIRALSFGDSIFSAALTNTILTNTINVNSKKIVDAVLTSINWRELDVNSLLNLLVTLTIKNLDYIKTIENYLLDSKCLGGLEIEYISALSIRGVLVTEIERWENLILETSRPNAILSLASHLHSDVFDVDKLGKKVIESKEYTIILEYARTINVSDKEPYIEAILESGNPNYIRRLETIGVKKELIDDKIEKIREEFEVDKKKKSMQRILKMLN